MERSKFQELIDSCSTFTEVLAHFGFENKGGNIRTLHERINHDNIDLTAISKNRSETAELHRCKKRVDADILFSENSPHRRTIARRRILRDKLIDLRCDECGLSGEWNGKPINLVLDHINGVPNDHRLANLRFLCPNCNSQQDTFAGRNQRSRKGGV